MVERDKNYGMSDILRKITMQKSELTQEKGCSSQHELKE